MRAATFCGIERIQVVDRPKPVIREPTDAVVEIELAGLCGSDLHPWSGREIGLDPGTIMGHEFTGRVVELGGDVGSLRQGDRVMSAFTTSCGGCVPCRRGLSSRCRKGDLFGWRESGHGLDGAQAEYVRVPLADGTLVRRPSSLSAVEALLLGDVVSTGHFAVKRAGVERGSVVAVVGLGAVGLAAVLWGRHLGAEMVLGFDRVRNRLELAERFGAAVVPLTDPGGAARSVPELAGTARELAGGDRVDCVIEAVGAPDALRLSVAIVRPGGFVSVAGVHTARTFPVSPTDAYDKNLTIAMGRCPVRSSLEELSSVQQAARLPIEELVTHRLPLAAAPDAYRMFSSHRDGVVKCVFDPTAS